MKRFTLIVALVLMVTMPLFAERVTPETARKAATTFLNNNGAKTNQLIDLSKAAGFPNLYIFTAEKGFVVMAADNRVKPILGYSLTGSFTAEDMPENVRFWLQGYNDEIQDAIDNKMEPAVETGKQWKDLTSGKKESSRTSVVVAPLIQTRWNQNKYYNSLCPAVSDGIDGHAYTGCVATAMAQVMNYWQHPDVGVGEHSYIWNGQTLSASFETTQYDWTHMALYYEYYIDENDSYHAVQTTNEENTAVATLMYHCGVSVEMNYGGYNSGGSLAPTSFVADALKNYFKYSPAIVYKEKPSYTDAQWKKMVKGELDSHRPLEYCGRDPNGDSGHAFVCDGYDNADYFHFNWGWAGAYDGYFSLDNLNTGANNQSGQGNGIYTRDQAAIFGIEKASQLTAPTLAASVYEGVATLTWNPIEEATSYDVFKDNERIGEGLATTTFSDNNLSFGVDYEYYVRAANSEETSNPSNTVVVNSKYRSIAPSGLTLASDGTSVSLNWTGYDGELSTDLHYGIDYSGYVYGSGSNESYWGQKFPSSSLGNLEGMLIEKVSTYLYYSGQYTLYLFSGDVSSTPISTLTYSKANSGFEWVDFNLSQPIPLDILSDLWVVIHYPSQEMAATISYYNGEGAEYSGYLSSTLENLPSNPLEQVSWIIRTYITDGTYTYNLYDGITKVNEESPISGTSYNVSGPISNGIHNYTVKTAYANGESSASNTASLSVGVSSLNSLILSNTSDNMTISSGSTLTVSGDLINTNPNNLILENGARLIHNAEDVQATVKKAIEPYTTNDNGWNFIASPVTETLTPSEENGFLNGTVGQGNNTYDLYYYDEPSHYWKNYETAPFNIVHKQGYLYANGETEGTTLQFAGTLTPSNNSVTINNLSHSSAVLNGFNLVGNPFVCNATVDKDFYVIDNTTNEVVLASQNAVIAPCEGVFVQASADNASVIFSKANAAKGNNAKDCFDIVVTQGSQLNQKNGPSTGSGTVVDRARLRLGEGLAMEKYCLDDLHTQISLWQDGQNYAVACLNGQDEMPLSFKVKKNGTYTLSIEAEHLGLSYLHLIDNMTGNDVDLLATPNYIFEAKTTDYASRFRLVFNASPNLEPVEGPTHFAYISNGEIIITTDAYDASLQIVDMTGRVMVSRSGRIQCVPTTGMAPGVYVLRLINTDGVKTQKIVIE